MCCKANDWNNETKITHSSERRRAGILAGITVGDED